MTQIVLITGANKGIGYQTARHVAAAGHTVLLTARDKDRGAAAAARLAADPYAAPGTVRFIRLDVTEPDSAAAAAGVIDADHGRLDVLVNNAAISRDRDHPPLAMPVPALREVYETNVFGVVAVTNAMLPLLRRSAAGYVANVSSGLGTVAMLTDPPPALAGYATLLAYSSSKAALNAVTMIYARALRPDGITVNALSPGFVATDLNDHAGPLTAEQGGANIARQVLHPPAGRTGVFLSERGDTYPW